MYANSDLTLLSIFRSPNTASKYKKISKMGMNNTANNTFYPSLTGNLLTDPIPKNEQLDLITLLYKDCLFGGEEYYAMNVGFRTKNYVISLVESVKKATSPFDDK